MNDESLFDRAAGNRRDFLRVEAELSLSFAEIALAAEDPEKRKRNAANAKRGYDTLLYFLDKESGLDGEELSSIERMIATLKAKLEQLGQLPEIVEYRHPPLAREAYSDDPSVYIILPVIILW